MKGEALQVHAVVVLSQADAEYSLGLATADIGRLRQAEKLAEDAAVAFAAQGDKLGEAKGHFNRALAMFERAKIEQDVGILRSAGDAVTSAISTFRAEGDHVLLGNALLIQLQILSRASRIPIHVESILDEAEQAFSVAEDLVCVARVKVLRGVALLRSCCGVPLFGLFIVDEIARKAANSAELLHKVAASGETIKEGVDVLLELGRAQAVGEGLRAQGIVVFIEFLARGNVGDLQIAEQLFGQSAEKFHEAGHRYDEMLSISMQSSAMLCIAPKLGDPDLFSQAVTLARSALGLAHESNIAIIALLRLREAQGLSEYAMMCDDKAEWRSALTAIEEAIGGFAGMVTSLEASLLHTKAGILSKIALEEEDREMFLAAAEAFAEAESASMDDQIMTSSIVHRGVALASAAFLAGEYDEMTEAVAALAAAVESCRQAGDLKHLAIGQMSLAGAMAELAIRDRDAAGVVRASALLEDTAVRFEALGHEEGASEARALASGLTTEWSERVGRMAPPSDDGGKA